MTKKSFIVADWLDLVLKTFFYLRLITFQDNKVSYNLRNNNKNYIRT